MSDTPTQRGLPPELDRIAHQRRAQLIDQLHRQAIATANDLAAGAQKRLKQASLRKFGAERLKLGCLLAAAFFIVALGSILALWALME